MNTTTVITLTDLAIIKNLLDASISRGTFKPNELKTVGEMYEKLDNFLNYALAQSQNAEQSSQQGETND